MRILVADDDEGSARALAELLTVLGHEVVGPAADGDEAVALAAAHRPELAIFDLDMPRVSGLEAIERIARVRPIPVIVLTGRTEPEYVDRASRLPVFHFLNKPAAADRLIPAILLAGARFAEWSSLHGRVGELTRKMEERKTVERAKGILMDARGVSEPEAYALLRRESQKRARPLFDVARDVVAAGGVLRRAPAPRAPESVIPS